MKNRTTIQIILAGILMLSGCSGANSPAASMPTATSAVVEGSTPTDTPVITPFNYGLATPVADSPAAGICASFDGLIVTVQILPGMPDPRCVQVRAEQQLSIANGTEETIEVGLGPFSAQLTPGQEYRITTPFEAYLGPGVHVVNVTPCCGGEIVYGIDLGQ